MIQFVFLILIPCLVIGLCVGLIKPTHAPGSIEPSWRLDTQTNYTIDIGYWDTHDTPQDRHYYFNISKITNVSPDGIERNMTLINGAYPGPLMEANSGDVLYIHVLNELDEPTTIHCHGLFFSKESYNDGASSINQCPIPGDGGEYTYRIHIDEDQWGTYWYHSHYGAQQADGIFGPIVIHSEQERKILNTTYDEDVVVMVNDYYQDMANVYMAEYLGPDNENTEPVPDDGLIQGSNSYEYNPDTYVASDGSSRNITYKESYISDLKFHKDKTYRVRLINAGYFAQLNFAIDEHKLKVIEADGTNTEPLELESVDLSVAQRYSFILEPPKGTLTQYWMRARFNTFCFNTDNSNLNPEFHAIVRYNDGNTTLPESESWPYNGGDVRCRDLDQSLLKTLGSTVPLQANGSTRPDVSVDLEVSFQIGAYQLDRGYFNDMTWKPLVNSSTMTELALNPGNNSLRTLSPKALESKNSDQYLLNFDQRGQIVDLIINNYDDGAHPFHMHGHKFWVLMVNDRGYFQEDFYDQGSSPMNFQNPILRDTVSIPGFGYGVIRFVVDNPGVWPFHCHIGWHMESGLLLQINELQDEYSRLEFPETWKNLCVSQ
ncbi:LAMI_0E16424g1_1 [Lachancea mirantina]|uniref:LAMI_0E16424g1_1 n=1 Tax=Lachancea mirantina TaxID=1230905 RepID=A0A1G4JT42_9SACH|nr:LAMI_0E16424g1_1 [Lachancea mirantina]